MQFTGRNGGEDTLAHWPIASGVLTVDDATLQILNFLDKAWSSLSSSGSFLLLYSFLDLFNRPQYLLFLSRKAHFHPIQGFIELSLFLMHCQAFVQSYGSFTHVYALL